MAHLAAYQPRAVEHGVLYRVIDEQLEKFLDAAAHHADGHRLPKFVEQESGISSRVAFWTMGSLVFGAATVPSSGSSVLVQGPPIDSPGGGDEDGAPATTVNGPTDRRGDGLPAAWGVLHVGSTVLSAAGELAQGVREGEDGWESAFIRTMLIVKLDDFGKASLITGATEIGQGSETVLAMIVAETLGVPVERVTARSACVASSPPTTSGARSIPRPPRARSTAASTWDSATRSRGNSSCRTARS